MQFKCSTISLTHEVTLTVIPLLSRLLCLFPSPRKLTIKKELLFFIINKNVSLKINDVVDNKINVFVLREPLPPPRREDEVVNTDVQKHCQYE